MTSFRRALFGYRRPDVDAAIAARDLQISGLEQQATAVDDLNAALESQIAVQTEVIAAQETDLGSLAGMVLERERTIRDLTGRLEEANACHDRSIASLDKVSARLEELQAQARGQATRIRMKALREAVEVSRRAAVVSEIAAGADIEPPEEVPADEVSVSQPSSNGNGNGHINGNGNGKGHIVEVEAPTSWSPVLYEGRVRLEVGPLGDFSQLVGFEDAVGKLGATDVSVERFSEGRATFSMRLDNPVDLLSELEDLSTFDFKVRHTAPDTVILDVDEDGSGRHAA